ncbi:hypothetical protein [Azospirillum picis]|uniref:Uncharacterized protein n=1 Tax=Azospirillum picis TaxID=488438 RepID=A0ABU0MUD8_9PROT|nr:hypothetical protein [Azospirillum picis]MBP2303262.1 hypothetical protein [Azospirillum picis]MDQ0537114.1 hypothetical protein [Azospirillum picis]
MTARLSSARLSERCTSLFGRARAAWLAQPLARRLAARKAGGRNRLSMELLDLELFRVDIGG